MGYFQSFIRQFRLRLFVIILINNAFIVADWYIVEQVIKLTGWWAIIALTAAPLITLGVVPWLSATVLAQPTKFIWQAITRLTPEMTSHPHAPDSEQVPFGRDFVTHVINEVYQLVNAAQTTEHSALHHHSTVKSTNANQKK